MSVTTLGFLSGSHFTFNKEMTFIDYRNDKTSYTILEDVPACVNMS